MKCLKISKNDSKDFLFLDIKEGWELSEFITMEDFRMMETGEKFVIEIVELPEKDYKALPEFDGDW
jgi:hypothetical protein